MTAHTHTLLTCHFCYWTLAVHTGTRSPWPQIYSTSAIRRFHLFRNVMRSWRSVGARILVTSKTNKREAQTIDAGNADLSSFSKRLNTGLLIELKHVRSLVIVLSRSDGDMKLHVALKHSIHSWAEATCALLCHQVDNTRKTGWSGWLTEWS